MQISGLSGEMGHWSNGSGPHLGGPAMSVLYHLLPSPCLFLTMSSLTESPLLRRSDSEARVLPSSLAAPAGPFLWVFVDHSAPHSTGGGPFTLNQVNLEFLSTSLVGDPGPYLS